MTAPNKIVVDIIQDGMNQSSRRSAISVLHSGLSLYCSSPTVAPSTKSNSPAGRKSGVTVDCGSPIPRSEDEAGGEEVGSGVAAGGSVLFPPFLPLVL